MISIAKYVNAFTHSLKCQMQCASHRIRPFEWRGNKELAVVTQNVHESPAMCVLRRATMDGLKSKMKRSRVRFRRGLVGRSKVMSCAPTVSLSAIGAARIGTAIRAIFGHGLGAGHSFLPNHFDWNLLAAERARTKNCVRPHESLGRAKECGRTFAHKIKCL